MAKKIKQLPKDINQKAKSIVDALTKDFDEEEPSKEVVMSAAAILGRKGGLKGGKARAKALTPEKRSEIAKKAAAARWAKKKKQ